jgi:hypothetical protein
MRLFGKIAWETRNPNPSTWNQRTSSDMKWNVSGVSFGILFMTGNKGAVLEDYSKAHAGHDYRVYGEKFCLLGTRRDAEAPDMRLLH